MDHESHVCASLPKIHLSVDVIWCSVHQAWTLRTSVYREDAEVITVDDLCTAVRFGPFDGTDAVNATSALIIERSLERIASGRL